MDLFGEFHKVEIDGKPFLVYRNVMKPFPQTHTPISQIVIDSSDDFLPQPLFLCPHYRIEKLIGSLDGNSQFRNKFETSPLFDDTSDGHPVLPLFWCNNKEVHPTIKISECHACYVNAIGTDYYFCVECDRRFHKECVESPLEISHPSHLNHSLQLCFPWHKSYNCIDCKTRAYGIFYYCALCNSHMHVLCAMAKIPLFIDKPKRHDHTLSLFPRHPFLHCNICGLINKLYLTYVCPSICDFVAHTDCLTIPQTIRISRHPYHRVFFTSSLPLGNWSCGVCRQEINRYYGSYSCNMCNDYAVHTRCALRKDIWDGLDLEGVPEVEDVVEPPFKRIADGIILHFSHGCNLTLETNNGVYDDEKFCQACILPIYEKEFYVCVKCGFILHERCAEAPRKKFHPLHRHSLELKVVHEEGVFECAACERESSGFGYRCTNKYCDYMLDAVCATVSEPFNYQGHQPHPLFLALDPNKKIPTCHICKSEDREVLLNCIECDFVLCFMCATLPYMVRYKHDEHYLTFCRGDEASGLDWCELCEGKLAIGGKEGFYQCNDCCSTLHIICLLGPLPYLKPGLTILDDDSDGWLTHRNNSLSRPICGYCNNRCPYPVYAEKREGTSTTFSCGGCV